MGHNHSKSRHKTVHTPKFDVSKYRKINEKKKQHLTERKKSTPRYAGGLNLKNYFFSAQYVPQKNVPRITVQFGMRLALRQITTQRKSFSKSAAGIGSTNQLQVGP